MWKPNKISVTKFFYKSMRPGIFDPTELKIFLNLFLVWREHFEKL